MPPMCFLCGSQQFVVAAGITPRLEPVLIQRPIFSLKPEYLVLTSAVVPRNASGQQTIYDFELRADQLDAKSIGEWLQN